MSTPAKEIERPRRSDAVAQGRAALAEWERAQPDNCYESDQQLQHILAFYWGADRLREHEPRLRKFGGAAATIVDQAVRRANEVQNLPRLERYNAVGARTEAVIHSADHHLAGRYIYGSGALSVYAEPGNNVLALALDYLSAYNGEAGHNCPLACTAGVIKTLQFAGSRELQAKYLPRLLESDYDKLYHGAQFLTEVQGGSDVGANACVATLGADGAWRISGEKWFCSNVTADLALVTARPEGGGGGTKGLGLFLVPRRLDDGSLNGMYIRRLKDKLGTKSLATAEVDFRDCVAYQIGGPQDGLGRGFQHALDYVINTSRLYNAVGSAALARRAYVIAWTYAQQRQAFGQPIAEFPLVQETLAEMRCEVMAMTAGTFYLAHLRDLIELGQADETDKQFFRFAVNLNKYYTSITATNVVRRAMEILGGNGVMENFSVLPRLLRDSLIFETWEGAHNTLLAQTIRDVQRHKLHQPFLARLKQFFISFAGSDFAGDELKTLEQLKEDGLWSVERKLSTWDFLSTQAERSVAVQFRTLAESMMTTFYLACLGREAIWEKEKSGATDKLGVACWFNQLKLGGHCQTVAHHLRMIAEVSAVL